MGLRPGFKAICVSYGSDLARKFGRRTRSIIKQQGYRNVFGTGLSSESSAADEWALDNGSDYMAGGVLSGITGNRADFIAIDDPIKGRQEADSETTRQSTLDAYQDDILTRLKPGGSLMITQCLTGDALVTMADGSKCRMDAVKVDNEVLSWDGLKFVPSKVSGVIDNGNDQTYLIRTNRAEVRANARHPFLVLSTEGLKWVRTKNLMPGMRIVAHRKEHTNKGHALVSGAESPLNREECALTIISISGLNGRQGIGHLRSAAQIVSSQGVNGATELTNPILTNSLPTKTVFAQSARQMEAQEGLNIGSLTSFPTITTKRGKCAAFFATIATGLQDELEIPPFWNVPSNTSEPDIDEVQSVKLSGVDRVYDLSIDGTHNFIANDLVTHNTRWHEMDLAGSILPESYAGESGMIQCRDGNEWEVICIPAKCESLNDPLGREIGDYIWPEWFPRDHWATFERIPRTWSALYQQRPAPDSGDYFKAEWIHKVNTLPARHNMRIYGGSDYAVTADGGDYTVHIVLGLDPEDKPYLLDVWRSQSSSEQWVEAFCDLVLRWKPIGWAEETGQIKSGVGPFLTKRMIQRKALVYREAFPTRGDKAIRAQSIRGKIALHGLYIHEDAPFYTDLHNEMMSFPVGVTDDQVDALGLIGQLIDRMLAGKPDSNIKPAPRAQQGQVMLPGAPTPRVTKRIIL
jgi:predicted phage terminase large subunit-like protein